MNNGYKSKTGTHHQASPYQEPAKPSQWPGKQTLSETLPMQTATASGVRNHDRDLSSLKGEIRRAYLGGPGYEISSVMYYRMQGVEDMKDRLNTSDPIHKSLLDDALSFGAQAAATAMSELTENPLSKILIGLGELLHKAFHEESGKSTGTLDPVSFGSHYAGVLSRKSQDSADKLLANIDNEHQAHAMLAKMKRFLQQPDRIKKVQANEVLDAWVNALKVQEQGGKPAGMGNKSLASAHTGQLHIDNIVIRPNSLTGPPALHLDHLSARLAGVPWEARRTMLTRRIEDIGVARTIAGSCGNLYPPSPHGGSGDTKFAFGIFPNGKIDIAEDQISNIAKANLASLGSSTSSDRNFREGIHRIWDHIKEKRLEHYVTTIDG